MSPLNGHHRKSSVRRPLKARVPRGGGVRRGERGLLPRTGLPSWSLGKPLRCKEPQGLYYVGMLLAGARLDLSHLPAQRPLCSERPVQLCTAPAHTHGPEGAAGSPLLPISNMCRSQSLLVDPSMGSLVLWWRDESGAPVGPVTRGAEPGASRVGEARSWKRRGLAEVFKPGKDLPPQSRAL